VSRSRKILTAVAVVAGWALVAGSPASAADCGPVNTEVDGLSQATMESSITCLINEERTSYGLQSVTPNDQLRQAAISHSNEMVAQGYFEHTSPAGLTFIDRIEDTGYMQGARSWTVGENLVWGSGPLSTPQSLVTAWMNSPPHRENLLASDYREVGMGVVFGTPSPQASDGVTVTTDFGMRQSPAAPALAGTAGNSTSRARGAGRARALRRCARRQGAARRRCVRAARVRFR
jgi:uncharacterized protein YkwD